MEVKGGINNKAGVMFSEAFGTACIIIAINWGGVTGATPQCVGFIVAICIQIFGEISGGHFNPAVTMAVLVKEGKDKFGKNLIFAVMIMVAQGIGAIIGATICSMGFSGVQNSATHVMGPYHATQLCPRDGCNDGGAMIMQVFICETVCTFVFTSFVLMVKYYNGADTLQINGYCVGLALYLAIRMASGITGGCINPAVGLIQPIYQSMANASAFPNAPATGLTYIVAYIAGPFLGGFLAGLYHKIMHEKAMTASKEAAVESVSKVGDYVNMINKAINN